MRVEERRLIPARMGGWITIALLLAMGVPFATATTAPPSTAGAIPTTWIQSSELTVETTGPIIDFTARSSVALIQAPPLEVSKHVREIRVTAELVDVGHANWVDRTGGVQQTVTFSIDVVPRNPIYGTHLPDDCETTLLDAVSYAGASRGQGATVGRFELLSRIHARTCTRSNIFAVWVTTGFFHFREDGETMFHIDHRLEASVVVQDPLTGEPWVDLQFPSVTDSTSRRYKPLFAFMVMDLDGKVNLNYAGNPGSTQWEGRGGVRAPAIQEGNTTLVPPIVDFKVIQRELQRLQRIEMTVAAILQTFNNGARLAIQAIR